MKINIIILIILPCVIKSEDKEFLKIPNELKIGVATSAYQIEGGWNASDKAESNWDEFTHLKNNRIIDGSNGDVACDSYHKYKEDIQLLKNTGFNHYRFSISWSRIFPTGFSNEISQDGIQYYKNLLDELHANGIEPFVTLYHWDSPSVLTKMGGWLNELIVDYFTDYARVVFKELGSRVKIWITFNEPNVDCYEAYGNVTHAPGLNMPGIGTYICGHNVLKAHARVYRMYNEEFKKKQNGKIGIVLSCFHFFPHNKNQPDSANIAFQYLCGWFANPIFSKNGDYPQIMKERIGENSKLQGYPRSRLPEFSPEWIQYIKGTFDYFGVNHYSSRITQDVSKDNKTGWYKDSGVLMNVNKSWPIAASDWLHVVPEGFGELLRKIKKDYNNPSIYVMENGYSGYGNESNIIDDKRINYLYSYMKEMLIAINRDKCDVKAYTVWSIMDNFEWSKGYTERFGIYHVNFKNQTRTPRLSVAWLNHVIRTRKLLSFDEFRDNFM